MTRVIVKEVDFGREVQVFVFREVPDGSEDKILRIHPEVYWDDAPAVTGLEPTFQVPREVAEDLGDALTTFFSGSSDVAFMREVLGRAERRVDTLIDGVLRSVAK